jgi:putative ABC transport system permease protein
VSVIPTLARRSLRARVGRSIFIGLAIMAGVAFVAGSFILADSLRGTFDNLIDGLTGETDLEVRSVLEVDSLDAQRDPLPVALVDQVAAVPGVDVAEGGYGRFAQLLDQQGDPVVTGGAPTLGVSWNPDSGLSGVVLKDGNAPHGIDEIALDKATADRVGYHVGDRAGVILNDGRHEFTVVGLVGLGNSDSFAGASIVVWDTDSAAALLDTQGTVDTIDIKVDPGANIDTVKADVAKILPARTEVITGQELANEIKDQVGKIVSVIGLGLLIFALITAFVAAFVINNVYGITIGQRLRELALLRAVGARGRQVRRLVLMEALIVSIIATVIGIFGGFAVAKGLIALFNAGGGFPPAPLKFQVRTAIVAAVVGIGTTVLSVLVPAWRASRIPPVAAMRPEAGFGALSLSKNLIRGVLLTVAGLTLFIFGILARPGSGPQWGLIAGVGALCTIFGATSLSGAFARPVARAIGAPVEKIFGTSGKFARDNAGRNPRRTARTASALMIGVSVITAGSVFFASLRDTFTRILEDTTTFDYFVSDNASFQPLPAEVGKRMAALPELSAVSPFRNLRAKIGDSTATFTAVDPVAFPKLGNVDVAAGSFDSLRDLDTVMAYRNSATDAGVTVGDSLDVTWQNGQTSALRVVGLFDDNSLGANWFVSVATLESVTTQAPTDQFVVAKRADGVDPVAAKSAIEAALTDFPQATVQTSSEFVAEQRAQVDTVLNIVTALLAVAIIFSFVGIAITLALSVFERTREIGLLRAIGMNRRQLRRSIRLEAVIVSLFGVAVGIVVGMIFGVTLSYAVPNDVIDGVSIPWVRFVFVVLGAALAAIVAALYPAFKASRMNVLEAIATE